jgi:F0F1-type ATP synthase assembly protein I
MYALIRHIGVRESLLVEAPSLTLSMIVAELFYKFHSFTLECVAFLATWLVVSYLARLVPVALSRTKKGPVG